MRGFSEGKSDVTKQQRPLVKPKIAIIFIRCYQTVFISFLNSDCPKQRSIPLEMFCQSIPC